MAGSDLFLRGRGADIGVRAPGWLVRACGAALAFACTILADQLGIWQIFPIPGWILHLLALGIGATLAPSAVGSLLWVVSGLLTAMLMTVMYTPLVGPTASTYIRSDIPASEPVQAVLVLSGSLSDDGLIKGQALDRLLSGMALAKKRMIPELALSIVSHTDRTPPVTSEQDQLALVQLALPGVTPQFVRNVHSTRDEALAFAALARTHQWQRVAVVTSPLHSRRACLAVEKTGLQVECRPASGRDYSVSLTDHAENRRLLFEDVLYEAVATAVYRVRGWL